MGGIAETVTAAIALGGNLGDSERILVAAIQAIDREMGIAVVEKSHLYKTAPIGPPQPDYLNACILVKTTLVPRTLLQRLLTIEHQFGRVRQGRWGARSLDLDLLLFGDQIIDIPGLTVPHPRLHERPFVLVPLMDIIPGWPHPIFGKTIAQLLAPLTISGVERLAQPSSPPILQWH
ncbi:MAG: 2-amino-4-hydroxy-6-hydroxymethyldihydropteridine diphosphokinase [Phormidesmis sp. RL_2_1]|nr:2-amino-4-hydroxy-6-hydroxymethyldihydropteridine diphosphokinase [Phormidesmis sp. RL_2_1]